MEMNEVDLNAREANAGQQCWNEMATKLRADSLSLLDSDDAGWDTNHTPSSKFCMTGPALSYMRRGRATLGPLHLHCIASMHALTKRRRQLYRAFRPFACVFEIFYRRAFSVRIRQCHHCFHNLLQLELGTASFGARGSNDEIGALSPPYETHRSAAGHTFPDHETRPPSAVYFRIAHGPRAP